jgi:hypothetical protein
LILPILLLLGSCGKDAVVEVPIELPPTPIISNDQSWAVVTEAYLKVTSEKDRNSQIQATLRKGTILEILSSQIDRDTGNIWYRVRGDNLTGWVTSLSVKQFENREQAETASREADREKK